MNLEISVIPFLEEVLVIVSLIFHGDLSSYVDARVKDLGFEN